MIILGNKLEEDTRKFTGDAKYKDLINDIKELIKFIRAAERTHSWNLEDLDLRTITQDEIFGKRGDGQPTWQNPNSIEMNVILNDVENL